MLNHFRRDQKIISQTGYLISPLTLFIWQEWSWEHLDIWSSLSPWAVKLDISYGFIIYIYILEKVDKPQFIEKIYIENFFSGFLCNLYNFMNFLPVIKKTCFYLCIYSFIVWQVTTHSIYASTTCELNSQFFTLRYLFL